MTFNLSVIVLAAGLSRRMGAKNKLLLPFRGKTIVETTIDNILTANIGKIIVVVGHESEKLKTVLEKYPLPTESGSTISIIENLDYEKGMTTSIKAGIRAAMLDPKHDAQNEGYMICLSDMVLIEPEEYRFLAQQFRFYDFYHEEKHAIFQPVFEGKRGNPVIFSNFYKNILLETTDTEGCRSVVQKYKNHVHLVEMTTNHILQDVDNKEEYEKLVSEKND